MEAWLGAALDYVPRWLGFQLAGDDQVGCSVAVAYRGELVLEHAIGVADRATGEALTPRHRFRAASHSKSFTAAGILLLREWGKLGLDDAIGRHVPGLHPEAAAATVAQVLSHSAGLGRDGEGGGQFSDRRPFLSAAEVRAALAEAPPIEAGTRFKYSNLGYGLLGQVIEAVTGEPWAEWTAREVIGAFGLAETVPDMPLPPGAPFARGHTGQRLLGGRRLVIPGDAAANGVAPAAGVVSTAADVARFYAQLAPEAARSPLSAASRREMTRRQWRCPHATFETQYGYGLICGTLAGWDWFGHTGGLQGYLSRTVCVPAEGLSVSVLTNALDGLAGPWVDGVLHILRSFRQRGAPAERLAHWTGRWWGLWGAFDLVPAGDRVLMAGPGFWNPFMDAAEIEVDAADPDRGRVALANGYGSHGEAVALRRGPDGAVAEVWMAGTPALPEAAARAELEARYGAQLLA